MDSAKLLVRNLKALRRRHGLTQEEFAEAAGMDAKYYQHIEAGRRSHVRLDTLDRLASAVQLHGGHLILPDLPETTSVRGLRRKSQKPTS